MIFFVKKLLSNTYGQTILEVLIALTLIVLFLSGIVIVELVSVKNVQFGQKKSVASKLASEQLERARVIRDSQGMQALVENCSVKCYINAELTPGAVLAPTGVYVQSLSVTSSSDCPVPSTAVVQNNYKLISEVTWLKTTGVTVIPEPHVVLSSCINDWR